MKNKSLVLWLLLLPMAVASAQESVLVMGRVTNMATQKPEPLSRVLLIQQRDTVANAVCDGEGYFTSDPVPVGEYLLSVTVRGTTFYQADLALYGSADLNIVVNTDSLRIRALPRVDIVANAKNMLGSQLITSPSDGRLWDFTWRPWMSFWLNKPPRNASASIEDPGD